MADSPTQDQIERMHRWFAVECNNNTWGLIDNAGRTPAADRDILCLAYAAAYHWSKVGAPVNNARADSLLAHVHAMLGHSQLALECARRCLSYCESNACEDWDLAFSHAEMAHAAWSAKEAGLHEKHLDLARQCGDAIKDAEDRKVFFTEFGKLPRLSP